MEINLTNKSNLFFGANISPKFLDSAELFLKNHPNAQKEKLFNKAVKRFTEMPNTDSIDISSKRIYHSGEASYALYARDNNTGKSVLLTAKNQFRKLLEKFSYMNEYEFNVKMGLKK